MALSNDLITQFVKMTNDNKRKRSESTVYGTVVRESNAKSGDSVEIGNTIYVRIDGSDRLTPVTTTADVEDGERVTVLIKDHSAIITGSTTSPSARQETVKELDTTVQDAITRVGTLEANSITTDQLDAKYATIENLKADKAEIKELVAEKASIEQLEADKAEIKELVAEKASIEQLEADKAEIKELVAEKASIEQLVADKAEIKELVAGKASIEQLEATNASIENLDVKYANIDFTNIGDAAIENLYAKSGVIKDLVVENGTVITGELVGVTIKGDLIEGNTIVADKLVVKGEDGLYYKLNTEAIKNGDVADVDVYVKMEEIEPVEGDLYCVVESGYITTENEIAVETIAIKELVNTVSTVSNDPVYLYADIDGNSGFCTCITMTDSNGVENEKWYIVENIYAETDTYIDAVDGKQMDGIYTTRGNQVYSYGGANYCCRIDKPVENAVTTTNETVYTYSTEENDVKTDHLYCIADIVCYLVNSDNTVSDTIIDPVEGSVVDGVTTTTGEQVYENTENVLYCVVDGVYYAVSSEYVKTDKIDAPGDGILVDGVTTTTGEQVYSCSITRRYCIRNNVYFSVVIEASSIELVQTEHNSLNGSIITAKTITATQISVSDLVAFDATIGGFKIDDNSISSTVKDSADNTTRGIYFDNDAQFNIGDANNYIRYLRNVTPIYTKSEERIKFAATNTFTCDKESISGLTTNPNPVSVGTVIVDEKEYTVYEGSTSSGTVFYCRVHFSTVNGQYLYNNYLVNVVCVKSDNIIDITGGTRVPDTTTTTGEDVYSYTDENGNLAFYCQSDNPGISGTVIEGALTTTDEPVYTYTDSVGTSVSYCIVDDVYYLTEYDENVEYNLVISASSVLYAMNGSQYSLSDLGTIGEYVKIGIYEGEPCIELGESDSNFKLLITNTKILFLEGTTIPAYFTNESLHISKAVIEDEMRFGKFVWQIRANGNMGLVWQETVEEVTE